MLYLVAFVILSYPVLFLFVSFGVWFVLFVYCIKEMFWFLIGQYSLIIMFMMYQKKIFIFM